MTRTGDHREPGYGRSMGDRPAPYQPPADRGDPVRIVADDTGHLVAWRGTTLLADVRHTDGEYRALLHPDTAATATVRAADLHLLTRLPEHVTRSPTPTTATRST